jgi:hypothetical protein
MITIPASAQTGKYPVKRIRAYTQESVSGTNTIREKTTIKKNFHWIYLETWPGRTIEITHLWIENVLTGFQIEKTTPPVLHPSGNGVKVIPQTSGEVFQIMKTDEQPVIADNLQEVPVAYQHFPLVIRYKADGKVYYLFRYPEQLEKERKQ